MMLVISSVNLVYMSWHVTKTIYRWVGECPCKTADVQSVTVKLVKESHARTVAGLPI